MEIFGNGNIQTITKAYMVVAMFIRGDSTDYSGCHVIDIEEATQVMNTEVN